MGYIMIDDPPLQLQSYQRAILAFLTRAKGDDDRITLWNGRLRWKSEMDTPPNLPQRAPIRGQSHDFIIIDEVAFPLDSLPKPSTLQPIQSSIHHDL